jgi:hypothetical protein
VQKYLLTLRQEESGVQGCAFCTLLEARHYKQNIQVTTFALVVPILRVDLLNKVA